MKKSSFPGLHTTILLLRISVAAVFMAHAIVRIANGSIPQFAAFLDTKGFVYPTVVVWVITVFETGGGLLLLLGRFTRVLSMLFIVLLIVGVVLIHAGLGWFVGEHGTGGMEYSFILVMALLVIAAKD